MKEVFKPVKGYEGLYSVSSFGYVKSLERKQIHPRGHSYLLKERILKSFVNGVGYLSLRLFKDGKGETFVIHRLMACSFFGHKYDKSNKIVVDHIDNNKLNNKLSNLQLITFRENNSKDRKNKSSKYTGVSRNGRSKKWRADITINGERIILGFFDEEIQAKIAYDNKVKSL